jgi:phosphoribosylamine--glycine ligase/phosphoribosylaminoimidazole synthetase
MIQILIIGSGGREHAIAKALAKSKQQPNIHAIGPQVNSGIAALGRSEVLDISNNQQIVNYAQTHKINITIVGSENQLQQGLVDDLQQIGIVCIGPTKTHARLETDKVYARGLLEPQYNPKYKVFTAETYSQQALKDFVNQELQGNYVIKIPGLYGGKGVKISGLHLDSFLAADEWCKISLLESGKVLIEEKLQGVEFSLMAFADGTHVVNMPPVQDYKLSHNGNIGLNTGSMGCVSYPDNPPGLTDEDIWEAAEINRKILQKLPGYVGILYGSFIKTIHGIKVIEYNCRFGDPEAINVLELLETDFLNILLAMQHGTLDELTVRWSHDAMITSYIVAPGYPNNPLGTELTIPFKVLNWCIFAKVEHLEQNDYLQLSSRSIAVWSRSQNIKTAYSKNQQLLQSFEKQACHYRTDIGLPQQTSCYLESGVDIAAGEQVVQDIKESVTSTWGPQVVNTWGDYAGLFNFNGQLLTTSTDGVGTKSIAAVQALGLEVGYYSLGQDLVNHCVNDILVKGAHPLFFLDYIASEKLNVQATTNFVKGVATACKSVHCALIGGETAEMPGVYQSEQVDMVGTIVGTVSPGYFIDGQAMIDPGDIIIGLRSSGPHTNGYSLIRRTLTDIQPMDVAIHRCYLPEIQALQQTVTIHGLCHITGGGWWGNIKRLMPKGMTVDLIIPRPSNESTFTRVQKAGKISDSEMLEVFNMGFGMLIFVNPEQLSKTLDHLDPEDRNILGSVIVGVKPRIELIG